MSAALLPQNAVERDRLLAELRHRATRLRILSIQATTEAGSGHPTSCASAADIVAALFFQVMRRNKDGSYRDTFILSKGHAAPLLYAAWAEAGAMPAERLLGLRKIDSDLEGHPTPRLPFVDVATGSLGQGLPAGVGMALDAKNLSKSGSRTYVLMGDGECAEGSVWEAAASAAHYSLGDLCAIVDVNRLGQSGPSIWGDDLEAYTSRFLAFGWNAIPVNGHDLGALLHAFEIAQIRSDRPSVLLARTRKGEGIPNIAGKNGHHGKPLSREEADEAIRSLTPGLLDPAPAMSPPARFPARREPSLEGIHAGNPPYSPESKPAATRKVFGEALKALGDNCPDIVVLDADVQNSTYTELFGHPDRFFQMFIAEQNMVGASMGLSACGRIPFAATFACFMTRAADFIRMAAIGHNNIKLVGSHAGISIGEDGPSQMGLEDLAMFCAQPDFTVFYPSDAVSAWRATEIAAQTRGPVYIRTTRPATPVLYSSGDFFAAGKCRIVRQSPKDRITLIGAGVTLFEALEAHQRLAEEGIVTRVIDPFCIQPLDREVILDAIKTTEGRLIVAEDHYRHGGIGEAICAMAARENISVQFRHLAVDRIPRSGSSDRLLAKHGISAADIVRAAHSFR